MDVDWPQQGDDDGVYVGLGKRLRPLWSGLLYFVLNNQGRVASMLDPQDVPGMERWSVFPRCVR